MAKLTSMDTAVLGISVDSPYANEAFAKQIGVTFPLLSDPKAQVMTEYGIMMRPKLVENYEYKWAQRKTFVVDKDGVIQHIEEGDGAVDPYRAVAVCTRFRKTK